MYHHSSLKSPTNENIPEPPSGSGIILSVLAEIRQSERSRSLVFLLLAQRDDNQHYYCHYIWYHVEELRRYRHLVTEQRDFQILYLQSERAHRAEQVRAENRLERIPGRENYERYRDPAHAGGQLLLPARHEYERKVSSAHAAEEAAGADVYILVRRDVDSRRVGGSRILADHAHTESGLRELHVDKQQYRAENRDIHIYALIEQHISEYRYVGNKRQIEARERLCDRLGQIRLRVALSGKARQTGAEYRQHKSGDDVIAEEGDCDDRVYKREQSSGEPRREDSQYRIAGVDSGDEAHDGSHQHHTLDSEVGVTDLFIHDTAECAEQYRRAHLYRGL